MPIRHSKFAFKSHVFATIQERKRFFYLLFLSFLSSLRYVQHFEVVQMVSVPNNKLTNVVM